MIKQCAFLKISQGLLIPRWLSAEMVNTRATQHHDMLVYMAVIATGMHAKAALVIVGFENLYLPVSILSYPFVTHLYSVVFIMYGILCTHAHVCFVLYVIS